MFKPDPFGPPSLFSTFPTTKRQQKKSMPELFISYCHDDERIAKIVYDHVTESGITAFLAELSINLGSEWREAIRNNLNASRVVLVLASKKACESAMVSAEVGGAFFQRKKATAFVWDMPPENLPGFLKDFQVVDLRGKNFSDLVHHLDRIVSDIKVDQVVQFGVLLTAAVGLYYALK